MKVLILATIASVIAAGAAAEGSGEIAWGLRIYKGGLVEEHVLADIDSLAFFQINLGACCLWDGYCLVLMEAECLRQGYSWTGPGIPCDPDPCIAGACCFEDGTCEVLTMADCLARGGIWLGSLVPPVDHCNPNPCQQPLGACCDWSSNCELTTEADCPTDTGNWLWQGPGTVCDPNPCPPTGACCVFDMGRGDLPDREEDRYMCYEMAAFGCFGIWLGAGTSCVPNLCAWGACCFDTGYCELWTGYECQSFGGTWMGEWTECVPNPCQPGPGYGACCFEYGCELCTEAQCQSWGGTWMGEGISCVPDPCH